MFPVPHGRECRMLWKACLQEREAYSIYMCGPMNGTDDGHVIIHHTDEND